MVKTVIWEYQYTPAVIDTLFFDSDDWNGIIWLYDSAVEKIKLLTPKTKKGK